MTVSSLVNRVQYAGNGVTTTFAYTFRILDEDDLTVIVTTALGVESTKTITTDYTVSGVGLSGGGNVVCTSFTPATGETLTLLRELDMLQETDLTPNDPLPAETLETAYDRACMISQQLDEMLGRSLVLKKSSPYTDLTLPDPSANKLLSWNAAGDDLENRAPVDVSLVTATAYMLTLLDDATAATARTTLGAAATTDHNTLATAFHLEHSTSGVHDTAALISLDVGRKNMVVNGSCFSQQGADSNLAAGYVAGRVDLMNAAVAGTITAGSWRQSNLKTDAIAMGSKSKFAAKHHQVTTTGNCVALLRHRIESALAYNAANKTCAFSCRVYHVVGADVTYTVTINKANAVDNFAAVTLISTGGTQVVPTATGATIKYEGIAMGDCSNGIEIIVTATVGATVTLKDFYTTDLQFEIGAEASPFELLNPAEETRNVYRYFWTTYSQGTITSTATTVGIMYGQTDGVANSDHSFILPCRFPVTMRAAPTCTCWDANGGSGKVTMAAGNNIAGTIGDIGTEGCWGYGMNGAAAVGRMIKFHLQADIRL